MSATDVLSEGPGSGSSPSLRCWADPAMYRIITLDQRGTGKSTPTSSIEENTLWDLVEDLEKLRKHLGMMLLHETVIVIVDVNIPDSLALVLK